MSLAKLLISSLTNFSVWKLIAVYKMADKKEFGSNIVEFMILNSVNPETLASLLFKQPNWAFQRKNDFLTIPKCLFEFQSKAYETENNSQFNVHFDENLILKTHKSMRSPTYRQDNLLISEVACHAMADLLQWSYSKLYPDNVISCSQCQDALVFCMQQANTSQYLISPYKSKLKNFTV